MGNRTRSRTTKLRAAIAALEKLHVSRQKLRKTFDDFEKTTPWNGWAWELADLEERPIHPDTSPAERRMRERVAHLWADLERIEERIERSVLDLAMAAARSYCTRGDPPYRSAVAEALIPWPWPPKDPNG